MKKIKLLWSILKSVEADKIFIGFIIFILVISFGFKMFEPGINTYGDALWYSFAVITTIGFGDLVAVTIIGRVLTIGLSLYGILVVALIPGIVVSYFMEFRKRNINESTQLFLDKLENLDELDKDELADLSKKIRERKYKL